MVKNTTLKHLVSLLLAIGLTACHPCSHVLEPQITYTPPPCYLASLPSAFPPLTNQELKTEWAKELYLGLKFAEELDLYRALTALKRAQFLIPSKETERRVQIIFSIIQCYYLGHKYRDAVETYEGHLQGEISSAFPALRDLLTLLVDSYRHLGECEKADYVQHTLEALDPQVGEKMQLYEAFLQADFPRLQAPFLQEYACGAKSVRTAQVLNGVLPGAGYYYVGQRKAALTSFLLNALFIAAAVHFFERGDTAAGLITTSLEVGWYVGGINGAGLAAKEWNEQRYRCLGKEWMLKERLFPVLNFKYAF